MSSTHHLCDAATSIVVDLSTGVPAVTYWGARLDDPAAAALDRPPIVHGGLDVAPLTALVPEHGSGWRGRPGLVGHRPGGTDWAPRFGECEAAGDERRLRVVTRDPVAGLTLAFDLELRDTGALVVSSCLTNDGSSRYLLGASTLTLPIAGAAGEVLSLHGRWSREFHASRSRLGVGAVVGENRSGRTSHESPPFVALTSAGASEWSGEAWGVHLAHSGNHAWIAEVLPDGSRYLQIGELLAPGEVCLEPGDSYRTPEVVCSYSSAGLTPMSWGLHREVRRRSPAVDTRRVLVNTWEAVYFDHDFERLCRLADAAAAVGVERFVLDDGWFGSRRDDTSGLGDWVVSPEAHPRGLGPLIAHVVSRGLDFGIWVEPEMVNEDSDVYRAHPEWVLADRRRPHVRGRGQLVLDLTNDAAFDHVLGQLDALLGAHDVSFVKWDMNRVHVAASDASGAAATSRQTRALYRLLDELRARHPRVEFESCASGGGRIDHGILGRTVRVWTSDCNDPLERHAIQRGASLFVPNEMLGAHVGPRVSHTTGRTASMGFRAATALFGWMGVECNLLEIRDDEREVLARAIAAHKAHRGLLHSGDVVRFDTGDDAVAHGVYATDRSEALVCYAQIASSAVSVAPPWRLPGLDPAATYDVVRVDLDGPPRGGGRSPVGWLSAGTTATGRDLAALGLPVPPMWPETALVVHLRRR